jgi:hypothetical protein
MLLNLVRLRFTEVPTFLAVNSVLTQYVWTGEIGVAGASGDSNGFPAWSVGGSGNLRYIERPTVTYTPLSGQEFAAQLLSPVRADVVFSLVSSGWPPKDLLVMALQRIGDVENVRFSAAPGEARDESPEFERVVELIIELAGRGAIELIRSEPADASFLEFSTSTDDETRAMIRELKVLLKLEEDLLRFRVTRRIVGRAPGEITVRMHSLLELMGLLSAGVEAPGAGVAGGAPIHADAMPLVVRCHAERPDNAFVAVQYAGDWYWLDRSDEQSKRSFGLLIYLFQMQASQLQGPGPLLTVPVG